MPAEAHQPKWVISELTNQHDRSGFDCGNAQLNRFLRELATQHRRRGLATTYVATRPGDRRVLGYYSWCTGHVDFDELAVEQRAGLPPSQPIPIVLLGRWAVDSALQRQGLGAILLMDAMHRTMRLSEQIGIVAMRVDAIDQAARVVYERFGFVALPGQELNLFLPVKLMRKIVDTP